MSENETNEPTGIELLFAEELKGYTHHGLPVYKVEGAEYAVADNEEKAQNAAIEAARDSLWAFRSSYLCSFLGFSESQTKAIAKMQETLCEDAGPIIEALLGESVSDFLEGAVDEDGRGHFLAGYDSEEADGEDVSPTFAGKLAYRIN